MLMASVPHPLTHTHIHTHTNNPPPIPPYGHWCIVCGSASILSNLITFLPFVASGAGSFAPWQWRSSHILWRCIPLIWGMRWRGRSERGEEPRRSFYQHALLRWLKYPPVHVYARVHGCNSQGIGCPLFVWFISNQP